MPLRVLLCRWGRPSPTATRSAILQVVPFRQWTRVMSATWQQRCVQHTADTLVARGALAALAKHSVLVHLFSKQLKDLDVARRCPASVCSPDTLHPDPPPHTHTHTHTPRVSGVVVMGGAAWMDVACTCVLGAPAEHRGGDGLLSSC